MTQWFVRTKEGVTGPYSREDIEAREDASLEVGSSPQGPFSRRDAHPVWAVSETEGAWWTIRGEKLTGPHPTAMILTGIERGQLNRGDSISSSANGPWKRVDEVEPFAEVIGKRDNPAPRRRRFEVVVVGDQRRDSSGIFLVSVPAVEVLLTGMALFTGEVSRNLGTLALLAALAVVACLYIAAVITQFSDASALGIPIGWVLLFGFCCLGLATRAIYFYMRERRGATVGLKHALVVDVCVFIASWYLQTRYGLDKGASRWTG